MNDEYKKMFEEDIKEFDNQAKETDKLYNETHSALERNLNRMSDKQMFGSSSPYRDIAELSKTLTGIRQTRISIVKERAAVKKTMVELSLKAQSNNNDTKNANTNEMLMKDILAQFDKRVDNIKMNNSANMNKGLDKLSNLDPESVGLNENDVKMIENFKGGK